MLGPILRGERISLEPVRPEDHVERLRWFTDRRVTYYLANPFSESMVQLNAWFEEAARDRNSVHWSIRAEGQTIGGTNLHGIVWTDRRAESSLLIGEPDAWGKGYATEAVRLRTEYAFNELGLEHLETHCLAGNVGMQRALEKNGFRNIGTKHEYHYVGGRRHDVHLFELLQKDWKLR